MKRVRVVVGFFAAAILFAALPAMAATQALGDIFFGIINDTENGFVLNNLTGDCGGAVGVCTPIILQNVVVSITPSGGVPFDVNMGDLPANSTTFSSALDFPNNQQFDLATVSGSASVTAFLLANGDIFQASVNQISATLAFPLIGDSAPILIEGEISRVPAPASLGLVGSGVGVLALLWAARRRHIHTRSATPIRFTRAHTDHAA